MVLQGYGRAKLCEIYGPLTVGGGFQVVFVFQERIVDMAAVGRDNALAVADFLDREGLSLIAVSVQGNKIKRNITFVCFCQKAYKALHISAYVKSRPAHLAFWSLFFDDPVVICIYFQIRIKVFGINQIVFMPQPVFKAPTRDVPDTESSDAVGQQGREKLVIIAVLLLGRKYHFPVGGSI